MELKRERGTEGKRAAVMERKIEREGGKREREGETQDGETG